MKKWWKGRRVLAYALAAVLVLGMMPAASVRAEEPTETSSQSENPDEGIATVSDGDGGVVDGGAGGETNDNSSADAKITFTPKAYDFSTKKLKVTMTISKGTVKYYSGPYSSDMYTNVLDASGSVDVECEDKTTIYVWKLDKDGKPTTGVGSPASESFPIDDIEKLLCVYTDSITEYKGIDTLNSWNPNAQIKNGVLYWTPNNSITSLHLASYEGNKRSHRNIDPTTGKFVLNEEWDSSKSYTFYFWGEGTGIKTKPVKIDYTYSRDPSSLPNVTNVRWADGKPGVITFDKLEDETNLLHYMVFVHYIENGKWTTSGNGGSVSATGANGTGKYEKDVSQWMNMGERYTYKVGVRAISKNPATIADSEEIFADTYVPPTTPTTPPGTDKPGQTTPPETNKVQNAIADALKNIQNQNAPAISGGASASDIAAALNNYQASTSATAEQKKAVAESLTTVLKNQQTDGGLRMAMQNNKDMIDLVKAVEELKGASVTPENQAADIVGQVSVVGAGLNGDSAGSAKLVVKKADSVDLQGYDYKNPVAIEIDLQGCGKAKTGLDIPVSVTISVPVGIDMDRLVIVHKGGNGNSDEVLSCHKDLANRTVTFTVTHFSTFVFAEEENSSGNDGGGGNGGGGSAESPSVEVEVKNMIASAKEGATVKIKGVQALSNGVMKMLLKRKDVTLVMEYTYKEKDYIVRIPAEEAVDDDIPCYGPLYLAGRYGNEADPDWIAAQEAKAAAEQEAKAAEEAAKAAEEAARAAVEAERAAQEAEAARAAAEAAAAAEKAAQEVEAARIAAEAAAKAAAETEAAAAAARAAEAAKESVYIVKKGDTMSAIAKANGMTLEELAAKNPQVKNLNFIKVGQEIKL